MRKKKRRDRKNEASGGAEARNPDHAAPPEENSNKEQSPSTGKPDDIQDPGTNGDAGKALASEPTRVFASAVWEEVPREEIPDPTLQKASGSAAAMPLGSAGGVEKILGDIWT